MFNQGLVEKISDDFESTFTLLNESTLANMMGFDGDFEKVTSIINRYIPNAKVEFEKTNEMGKDKVYDIYLVKIVSYQ